MVTTLIPARTSLWYIFPTLQQIWWPLLLPALPINRSSWDVQSLVAIYTFVNPFWLYQPRGGGCCLVVQNTTARVCCTCTHIMNDFTFIDRLLQCKWILAPPQSIDNTLASGPSQLARLGVRANSTFLTQAIRSLGWSVTARSPPSFRAVPTASLPSCCAVWS